MNDNCIQPEEQMLIFGMKRLDVIKIWSLVIIEKLEFLVLLKS